MLTAVNKGLHATLLVNCNMENNIPHNIIVSSTINTNWCYPCELKALTYQPFLYTHSRINSPIIGPYWFKVLQAFHRLCQEHFSTTAICISTFPSTLSSYKVTVQHIPDKQHFWVLCLNAVSCCDELLCTFFNNTFDVVITNELAIS